MTAGDTLISVREIELQLRTQCEAVVRECLPNAARDGHWLRVGSIAGEKGQSLAIGLSGSGRGLWTDYSSGETGDLIHLIRLTRFGGDIGQAVQWAKSWLGLDDMDPGRLSTMRAETAARDADMDAAAARETEAKKRGARALWHSGVPLGDSTPAARYLEGRGLDRARLGKWPGSLVFHEEVWNADAGVKLPAMLAQMFTPDGVHVATHRTWLGRDARRQWVKADGADLGVPRGQAKKVIGKSGGAFVPLRKGASGVSMGALKHPDSIYLTEGIEDALTVAMAMPAARVAAAYSLRNIGMIVFPPLIERIVIVADRDEDPREVEALERAIARQQARGHHVQIVMPPVGVKDVNAWLNAPAQGQAA